MCAAASCADAVLEAVARERVALAHFTYLRRVVRSHAASRLHAAEAGSDVAPLERAIELATAVQVDADALSRAQATLDEMNRESARRARRESLGLGSLSLPEEFMCPITMDKMRGLQTARAHSALTRHPINTLVQPLRVLPCVLQIQWWRLMATRTSAPPSLT